MEKPQNVCEESLTYFKFWRKFARDKKDNKIYQKMRSEFYSLEENNNL